MRMKVCRVARRLGQGGVETRGRMSLVVGSSGGVGEGREGGYIHGDSARCAVTPPGR